MENNNNNNSGGIVLKSNDACNKGFDFLSAKKCMDFDLNVPFVETNPVDESSQVFSNNVPMEPTLMRGFVNSEPHVQFQAPKVALSTPPQGEVHAPSHHVHTYNNNYVQLVSSGEGSRVGGMMLKNGTSNKRKFDWKSIREEMNVSFENNVIDFTSPLTTEKVVKALLEFQIEVVPRLPSTVVVGHDARTTSRMIFSPQGNVVEPAPNRRKLDEHMTEYAYNKQFNKHKYVLKILSDVDIVDDGFNWRKYGQKLIKNLGSPRCYYKCTTPGCTVRKQVEREAEDIRYVITTYEGKHNHPVPLYRKKYNKNNNNNNGANSDNNNNAATTTAAPPAVVTTTEGNNNNNNYGIHAGQNNIVGGIFNNNNNNNMNMMGLNLNLQPPPPPVEGSSGVGIIGHNLNHVMNNSIGGSGGLEEAQTLSLGGHFLMKDNGHGGFLRPNGKSPQN